VGDKGPQVFISYNRRDRKWLDRLQVHLAPLVRNGAVTTWADTRIRSGQEWETEIQRAIASARVAVLLVTPDFLASDFIQKNELPPILQAAQAKGLSVLWVSVSPSLYKETPLSKYQAANNPSRPLSSLSRAKSESELVQIAQKIKEMVQANPVPSTLCEASPTERMPAINESNFLRRLLEYDDAESKQGYIEGLPPPAAGVLTFEESKLLRSLVDYHEKTRWARSVTAQQLQVMSGISAQDQAVGMADDLVKRGYLKTDDKLRYRAIRDAFAQWSRTPIFLLELYRTDPGPHGTVPVKQLFRALKDRFHFDDDDFISDLRWASLVPKHNVMRPVPSYVLCYYNDDEIGLNDRFENELDFLILGAEKYARDRPERADEVKKLLDDVTRIRKSHDFA
jgi:hypothetical protein